MIQSKFIRWTAVVDADRKEFREFMTEIREDVKKILLRTQPTPIATSSPIRLTDLGETISNHINAKSWAKTEADNLLEKTRGMDSLEIQTLSFDHAENHEPNDLLLSKMQESAFESGIDLLGVRKVLGVELRDRLLQLNNLTHSSLDK